jgi:hypothetical protein
MPKPVVHFIKGTPYRETLDDICWFSYVYALDHPRLGRGVIRTSQVIKEFDDGSFETMNTIYVPVEGEYNEVVSD